MRSMGGALQSELDPITDEDEDESSSGDSEESFQALVLKFN